MSLYGLNLTAQGRFSLKNHISQKIKFEFKNNLIIIPLKINDVSLSFILDTGVSKPILFNLSERDLIDLKNTETFYLHGLGADGKIRALKSSYNRLKIGNVEGVNQDLYVIYDKTINFTPRLGVVVHGIIGFDIFKDFVVEINYNSKYIRLHKLSSFKPRSSKKWETVPIDIYKDKPYIDAEIKIHENIKTVKLLLDTGSSDALWLFEDEENGLTSKQSLSFDDYLGKGLSGPIYGKRSKLKNLVISDFNLKDINVAFPDSLSIDLSKVYEERNGSLGGDVLKRFNHFFDYTNKKLYLKKNRYYNDPFTYNNSGIVLEYNGTMFVQEQIKLPNPSYSNSVSNTAKKSVQIDFFIRNRIVVKPRYKIVEIRKSSNAYIAGLRVGDVLMNINKKPSFDYTLSEINEILYGKTGKTLRLKIERKGIPMSFKFKLDDVLKK